MPWMSVSFPNKMPNLIKHCLRNLIYQAAQQFHIAGASVLFTCQWQLNLLGTETIKFILPEFVSYLGKEGYCVWETVDVSGP